MSLFERRRPTPTTTATPPLNAQSTKAPTRSRLNLAGTSALASLAVLLSTYPTHAVDFSWNNSSSSPTLFTLASNWAPNTSPPDVGPPDIGDTAIFPTDCTDHSIFLPTTHTLDAIRFQSVGNTFDSIGGLATLNITTGDANLFAEGGDATFGNNFFRPIAVNVGNNLRINTGSILTIQLSSSIDVDGGAAIGATTNGTLIVDNSSASADFASDVSVGLSGGTGVMRFENGATGILSGTLFVMDQSSVAGTTGRVKVFSGASLQTANILVGVSTSNSAVQTAEVIVDGLNSDITMTGASALTIGDDANPNVAANLVLSDGASFSTGTGTTLVRNSGEVLAFATTTFNVNGPLDIDGGSVSAALGDNLVLASDTTAIIQNSGKLVVAGNYNLDKATTIDVDTGGELRIDGTADFSNGAAVNINDEGSFNAGFHQSFDSASLYIDETAQYGIATTSELLATNDALIDFHPKFKMNVANGASIKIEDGADFNAGQLDIGETALDGNGSLTVTGEGSTLTSTENNIFLDWGRFGSDATVVISDGAVADIEGSVSMAFSGSGSIGNLDVLSGASLNIARLVLATPNNTATINVDGTGSAITLSEGPVFNGELIFNGGTANMNLTDGGTFTTGVGGLGLGALAVIKIDGGTFNVNGPIVNNGGTLNFIAGDFNISGDFAIDDTGVLGDQFDVTAVRELNVGGTLSVTDGSELSINDGKLSATNIANAGVVSGNGRIDAGFIVLPGGELSVEPTKKMTIADSVHQNQGSIKLNNGELEFIGTLSNAAGANILARGKLTTDGMDNQGDINFVDGQTDVFGPVGNNATGKITLSENDVTFHNEVTSNGTKFEVPTGSSATFKGAYNGADITGDGDVIFESDVNPGFSPGQSNFSGNVTFENDASLNIELADPATGPTTNPDAGDDHDQVNVTSNVTLDGTLNVTLLDDYDPTLGDTFTVMIWGSHSGTFDTFNGVVLNPDGTKSLAVTFADTDETPDGIADELRITAAIPGDANLDGEVSIGDLSLLASNFNETPGLGSWRKGDFNHDGQITIGDLSLLASNFGQTNATIGSATISSALSLEAAAAFAGIDLSTIPEPATLSLLTTVFLIPTRRRRVGPLDLPNG